MNAQPNPDAFLDAEGVALDIASDDAPLPLFSPLPDAAPYPLDALGPALAPAAGALARAVQVPEAMSALSVLAAASLAAQGIADVALPHGDVKPLSLFALTIAGSGERKTALDARALEGARQHERALLDEHKATLPDFHATLAAWSAERRRIEGNRKLGFSEKRSALLQLGPEPPAPLHALLTVPEPTIEGLIKLWVNAPPALGLFSAEAGQLIGGHGFSDENRLKTGAALSELWDGRDVRRARAADGLIVLRGRRLAAHLMVQPDAARRLLADPVLRDQGLVARFLVAAPATRAGTRFHAPRCPADEAAIARLRDRLGGLHAHPLPLADGERNVLVPRALQLSPTAARAVTGFADEVERESGPSGRYASLRDVAAKAAEQAARIAGVLALAEDPDAVEVNEATARNGLAVARWHLGEFARLTGGAGTDPRLLRADRLLQWLRERSRATGEPVLDFRAIVTFGPNELRTKAALEEALAVLADHRWVNEASARPRRIRLRGEAEA